jgi:hypothetical protein
VHRGDTQRIDTPARYEAAIRFEYRPARLLSYRVSVVSMAAVGLHVAGCSRPHRSRESDDGHDTQRRSFFNRSPERLEATALGDQHHCQLLSCRRPLTAATLQVSPHTSRMDTTLLRVVSNGSYLQRDDDRRGLVFAGSAALRMPSAAVETAVPTRLGASFATFRSAATYSRGRRRQRCHDTMSTTACQHNILATPGAVPNTSTRSRC